MTRRTRFPRVLSLEDRAQAPAPSIEAKRRSGKRPGASAVRSRPALQVVDGLPGEPAAHLDRSRGLCEVVGHGIGSRSLDGRTVPGEVPVHPVEQIEELAPELKFHVLLMKPEALQQR